MEIYVNGGWYSPEDARVSVFDHGLLYGDGVFEGIRVYNRRIFRLEAHMHRLYDSARAIALSIPTPCEVLSDTVREAVRRNRREDAYIRLVVTRGPGDLGLDPRKCPEPTIFIIVTDIAVYPPEKYAKGIPIVTASTRQIAPDAVDSRVKSLNYLKNILAKIEAQQAGVEEAIMLNAAGRIAECTADNLFVIRRGELLTPPAQEGALEGITRNAVLELARKARVPALEAPLTRYDVYNAEECFLTGTGAELMPVIALDGRPIGTGRPGPVTLRLKEAFQALVRGEGEPLW